MKKFEFIPASRATRNGTNKTSSSGDENGAEQEPRSAHGRAFNKYIQGPFTSLVKEHFSIKK